MATKTMSKVITKQKSANFRFIVALSTKGYNDIATILGVTISMGVCTPSPHMTGVFTMEKTIDLMTIVGSLYPHKSLIIKRYTMYPMDSDMTSEAIPKKIIVPIGFSLLGRLDEVNSSTYLAK